MQKSFVINQGSAGVTLSAGVASSLTKVVDFQVQPGASIILDRDSILMLKDNGSTETANRSKIEVRLVSANQKKTETPFETTYNQLKYNQDSRIQYRPVKGPERYILQPFARLQVWINSDQTVATASTDFYLEAKQE